jgi:hypothetical protein
LDGLDVLWQGQDIQRLIAVSMVEQADVMVGVIVGMHPAIRHMHMLRQIRQAAEFDQLIDPILTLIEFVQRREAGVAVPVHVDAVDAVRLAVSSIKHSIRSHFLSF